MILRGQGDKGRSLCKEKSEWRLPPLQTSVNTSICEFLTPSPHLYFMASTTPSIQFFAGISEELSNVSLRGDRRSGVRIVLMTFNQLKAIERFNSFTKKSLNSLLLSDEEGEISVTPSACKFVFGGAEGDELDRVECKFEIAQDDHWERFMRFMHRYAEVNGMVYGEK